MLASTILLLLVLDLLCLLFDFLRIHWLDRAEQVTALSSAVRPGAGVLALADQNASIESPKARKGNFVDRDHWRFVCELDLDRR